jgi:hypothetical protein
VSPRNDYPPARLHIIKTDVAITSQPFCVHRTNVLYVKIMWKRRALRTLSSAVTHLVSGAAPVVSKVGHHTVASRLPSSFGCE